MGRTVPGIFCVEGAWSSNLADRASVRDLLDILEDVDGIDFIHTRVNTVEALHDVLRKWHQKQYAHYSLGYFAFHGKPGKILIGRHPVTLKELGMSLQNGCDGKTLYFGSCSVLKVPPGQVYRFIQQTGADCLVGFDRDIDWLASAALDLILLQALALQEDHYDAERWLRREYGALADSLGLQMFYEKRQHERPDGAIMPAAGLGHAPRRLRPPAVDLRQPSLPIDTPIARARGGSDEDNGSMEPGPTVEPGPAEE